MHVLFALHSREERVKNEVSLGEHSSGRAEKGPRSWRTVPLERLSFQRKFDFTCHAQTTFNLERTPRSQVSACPATHCVPHGGTCPQRLLEARLALRATNAGGEERKGAARGERAEQELLVKR